MADTAYDPQQVEKRWQQYWDDNELFKCPDRSEKDKFYCLVMFPYPSGTLHVGHGRNYIIGDVVARYKMMQDYHVLHPMGWDAFGLPAENAALKRNMHPRDHVAKNIRNMKTQIQQLGISYDWDREINTSEPEYYKWTQWVFLQLYKRGLAYRTGAPINWCPDCQTALANEEVVNGCCERCGAVVEPREMPQWFFKITEYAQRLLEDLETLDQWPDHVKRMQANWIGRSEGAVINFKMAHNDEPVPCFTTRPDTLWGVTYMALAPEYPSIPDLVKGTEREQEVMDFVERTKRQSALQRTADEVEKEGVFTGRHVINPVNGERVPLWVANYALMEYGTGAVMAVPAHDQRDFEFARKYDLPVRVVIQPEDEELDGETMTEAYEEDGVMTNSGPFDGTPNREGIEKVTEYLEENDQGHHDVNYKIRDWLISRQRFWGAPIPIIHCDECGTVPVPEEDLPVRLPDTVDFTPKGKSPLAFVDDFVNTTCPECGKPATRETDTIAQWLCSCWYFLRFVTPNRDDVPFDRELADYWLPVDQYIGGVEHAVLHLLYSRFIVKVLQDADWIDFGEPFKALFTQGMICKNSYVCDRCGKLVTQSENVTEPCQCDIGPDLETRLEEEIEVTGQLEKMSKSKGNVVGFDEVIGNYGTDTLRCYTLAIGPPEKDAEWQEGGIVGYHRFLKRLWNAVTDNSDLLQSTPTEAIDGDDLDGHLSEVFRLTHATIKKVTEDIEEEWHFNTAIAAVMELFNEINKVDVPEGGAELSADERQAAAVYRFALETSVLLLAPFVPHICEELWTRLGNEPSVFQHSWPEYDAEAAKAEQVEMPVQVNGKVRAHITVARDESEEAVREHVMSLEDLDKYLDGEDVKKVIVVPNRIVNVVV